MPADIIRLGPPTQGSDPGWKAVPKHLYNETRRWQYTSYRCRFCCEVFLHLGIRAFLGYDLAQPLPWHSTVSRTRQRLPVSVFEACFTHIVGLCIQQGLVSGHTQAVDSAYIKANASMSRLQLKRAKGSAEPTTNAAPANAPPITASVGRLAHIRRFQAAIRKANPTKNGRLVSNLTHYHSADPEARICFKTGKIR